MGFRVVHTADLHYGVRDEELSRVVRHIADTPGAVDLIVIAGDIYEGATTPAIRNRAIDDVCYLAGRAPVCLVEGNHERGSGADRDVDKFRSLRTEFPVRVSTMPERFALSAQGASFVPVRDPDSLQILTLPWPRRADYAPAGTPIAESHEAAMRALDAQFSTWEAAIRSHAGPSLVVAHLEPEGEWPTDDQPDAGGDLVVPKAWIARLTEAGAAVALGHIHTHGEVVPGARFSGSPRRTQFSAKEMGRKGYLVTTIEQGSPPVYDFRETPCARLVKVIGRWDAGVKDFAIDDVPGGAAGAEIKFCYEVPAEDAPAARRAAERIEAEWAAQGAVIAPRAAQTIPVFRGRDGAEQVRTARSTWDKVGAWLAADKVALSDDQRERMRSILALAEERAGVTGKDGAGVPTIHAVRGDGFMAYAGPFGADFDALSGRVVAVAGRNGTGKTSLLSSIPTALYRAHPDKARELADLVNHRDAFVEVDLTTRTGRFTLRVDIDGGPDGRRTTSATVRDASGSTLVGGKAGDYQAWVADNLPSRALYLSTGYCSQKRRVGLADATPADRKRILVDLIGSSTERLREAVSSLIRSGKNGSQTGYAVDVERLKAERVAIGDAQGALDAAQAGAAAAWERIEAARRVVEDRAGNLTGARAWLDEVRADVGRWTAKDAEIRVEGEAAKARAEAASEAHRVAQEAAAAAHRRVVAAKGRVLSLEERVADAPAVRLACDALPALREQMVVAQAAAEVSAAARATAEAALAEARRVEDRAKLEEAEARRSFDRLDAAVTGAAARVAQDERAVADLPIAERAGGKLPAAVEASSAATEAVADLTERVSRSIAWRKDVAHRGSLATAALATARVRCGDAERDAADLARVPCGGEGSFAACPYIQRAADARTRLPVLQDAAVSAQVAVEAIGAEVPPEWYVSEAEAAVALQSARSTMEIAIQQRDSLRALAVRLPDLQAAAARVEEARQALARARADLDTASLVVEQAEAALAVARQDVADAGTVAVEARQTDHGRAMVAADLAQRVTTTERTAARATEIDQARADLDAARADVDAREVEVRTMDAEKAARDTEFSQAVDAVNEARRAYMAHSARKPLVLTAERAVIDADDALVLARGALADAEKAHAVADARAADLESAVERARDLDVRLAAAVAVLDDAQLLERALGRDGVQALEIEAAAPAIASKVNDLFARAWGGRFSVAIDTRAPTTSGKAEKDGLWITAYDAETGKRGDLADVLGGGHEAVCDAGLRMGASIYAAEQAGDQGGTVFLDEAGAALDAENSLRYLAMVRAMAEIGGFGKVLFVSHNEAMRDGADEVVWVGGEE